MTQDKSCNHISIQIRRLLIASIVLFTPCSPTLTISRLSYFSEETWKLVQEINSTMLKLKKDLSSSSNEKDTQEISHTLVTIQQETEAILSTLNKRDNTNQIADIGSTLSDLQNAIKDLSLKFDDESGDQIKKILYRISTVQKQAQTIMETMSCRNDNLTMIATDVEQIKETVKQLSHKDSIEAKKSLKLLTDLQKQTDQISQKVITKDYSEQINTIAKEVIEVLANKIPSDLNDEVKKITDIVTIIQEQTRNITTEKAMRNYKDGIKEVTHNINALQKNIDSITQAMPEKKDKEIDTIINLATTIQKQTKTIMNKMVNKDYTEQINNITKNINQIQVQMSELTHKLPKDNSNTITKIGKDLITVQSHINELTKATINNDNEQTEKTLKIATLIEKQTKAIKESMLTKDTANQITTVSKDVSTMQKQIQEIFNTMSSTDISEQLNALTQNFEAVQENVNKAIDKKSQNNKEYKKQLAQEITDLSTMLKKLSGKMQNGTQDQSKQTNKALQDLEKQTKNILSNLENNDHITRIENTVKDVTKKIEDSTNEQIKKTVKVIAGIQKQMDAIQDTLAAKNISEELTSLTKSFSIVHDDIQKFTQKRAKETDSHVAQLSKEIVEVQKNIENVTKKLLDSKQDEIKKLHKTIEIIEKQNKDILAAINAEQGEQTETITLLQASVDALAKRDEKEKTKKVEKTFIDLTKQTKDINKHMVKTSDLHAMQSNIDELAKQLVNTKKTKDSEVVLKNIEKQNKSIVHTLSKEVNKASEKVTQEITQLQGTVDSLITSIPMAQPSENKKSQKALTTMQKDTIDIKKRMITSSDLALIQSKIDMIALRIPDDNATQMKKTHKLVSAMEKQYKDLIKQASKKDKKNEFDSINQDVTRIQSSVDQLATCIPSDCSQDIKKTLKLLTTIKEFQKKRNTPDYTNQMSQLQVSLDTLINTIPTDSSDKLKKILGLVVTVQHQMALLMDNTTHNDPETASENILGNISEIQQVLNSIESRVEKIEHNKEFLEFKRTIKKMSKDTINKLVQLEKTDYTSEIKALSGGLSTIQSVVDKLEKKVDLLIKFLFSYFSSQNNTQQVSTIVENSNSNIDRSVTEIVHA